MGRHLKNVRACITGHFKENYTKIRAWVTAAGGQLQPSLNSDTTHLIASKAAWKAQNEMVINALNLGIHIVNYDWLEDCLMQQAKKPEKQYLWSTHEAQKAKRNEQKAKLAAKERMKAKRDDYRAQKKAEKEAEKKEKASSRISYAKALTEHTDAFLATSTDTATATENQRVVNKAAKAKATVVAHRSASSPSAAGTQAAKTFREGARQAKNDIGSDNYHVYMDKTGFRYDVVVVKTDMLANKNERFVITLYETNTIPHDYAAHARHSGTGLATTSSTKSVIGSNYTTAFHIWKSIFKDKTGVDWDHRFEAFPTRDFRSGPQSAVDALQRNREMKAGGGQQHVGQKRLTEQEWNSVPFMYRVPAEGQPRGAGPLVRGVQALVRGVQGIQMASQVSLPRSEIRGGDDVVMSGGVGGGDVVMSEDDGGSAESSGEDNAQMIEDDEESSDGEDSDD